MPQLYIKLIGTPVITNENQELITLPFRKAEALLYFILIHKKATRDELVNLLWGDIDEQTAKKNLRNTLYKIRKALNMDIIISPQKNYVLLNPELNISTDIDQLIDRDIDENNLLEQYTGSFLQGFLVKDADRFEEWAANQKEHFKELIIDQHQQILIGLLQKKQYKVAEKLLRNWINLDVFDERAYRYLMDIYAKTNVYNKAIDVYNKLQQVLDIELGITPDAQTKTLFEEIKDLKKNAEHKETKRKDFFFGRKEELNHIRSNYLSFQRGDHFYSILISGEAGIGKTKIKQHFLESINHEEVIELQGQCYQAEENYFLKPWNQIFLQLFSILKKENLTLPMDWREMIIHLFPNVSNENSNLTAVSFQRYDSFQYQRLEAVILGIFNKISDKKKIILVLEDIQWADLTSLSVLKAILLHQKNIFFIGTTRLGYTEKLDDFITLSTKYNKVELIQIARFNQDEVENFLKEALPEKKYLDNLALEIYKQTAGNALFLVEMVNLIKEKDSIDIFTSNMQGILKSRLLEISPEGKKILNMVSIFFDEITLDMLTKLSGKDELEILDILEELQDKNILIEQISNDTIIFQFSHQKIREFIYQQQTISRKRILHLKAAKILENNLMNDKQDAYLYSKLIYHFTLGADKLNTLKYSILNAKLYFDYSHELFPVLDNPDKERGHLYITKQEAYQLLQEIETLLMQIKNTRNSFREIEIFEMMFLHMKGRYLIRNGEYNKGISMIHEMIEISAKFNYDEYTLKGYKQMIYYAIQTHQVDVMRENIELGLNLVQNWADMSQLGIMLRLKGLLYISLDQYKEAEGYLLDSIKLFESSPQKYALNIAAAYQYLGDIRRREEEYSLAIEYYEKAKQIAATNELLKGVTIFNTKAGQSAYLMNNFEKAEEYLSTAIRAYNKLGYNWGRAIAEGYLTLIYSTKREYDKSLKSLISAEYYADIYKSPYEQGIVNLVKTMIKQDMENDHELNEVLAGHLSESKTAYYQKATDFFEKADARYEVKFLEKFIQ